MEKATKEISRCLKSMEDNSFNLAMKGFGEFIVEIFTKEELYKHMRIMMVPQKDTTPNYTYVMRGEGEEFMSTNTVKKQGY
eukprot:15346955-Ditylum_brightwellii.AAC.1